MGEPKPLASLSAGLLARKGAARPAMRRQPLGSGPAATFGQQGYDDLGWNDMGYDVDPQQSSEPARMVDLKPLNNKLLERGARIIMEKLGISDHDLALELLEKHGSVRKVLENTR